MKNGVCALLYYIVHLITVLWNCIFSRFAMAGGDWSFGYVQTLRVKSVKRFTVVTLRPKDLLAFSNTYMKDKTMLESHIWLWCVTLTWTKDLGDQNGEAIRDDILDGNHRALSSIYFSLHLFSCFGSVVCCTP